MESKKFRLNRADLEKILVGACIAVAGAFLTYVSEIILQIDFGDMTPLVVALISVLVNVSKKALQGEK